MKKLFFTLVMSVAVFSAQISGVVAQEYKAGVHYSVIEGQATSQRELREYFSLLCPHCASMENFIPLIEEQLPEGMGISRTHVNFIGGYGRDVQDALTKGLAAAVVSDKEHDYIKHVFDLIHLQKKKPRSEQFVLDAMVDSGVASTPEEARKLFNATVVGMQQKAMLADQNEMVEKGVIKGVPSFVLNNRYLINLQNLDSEEPVADLGRLIRFLEKKGD